MLDSLISKAYTYRVFVMTWNKLLSMVVRVLHFSIFLFLVQIYISFFWCFLFLFFCIFFNYSLILFNNTAELKQWTQKKEINEIARETQCFTLYCHSTQCLFDFTNIIIEKRNLLRVEPANSGSQAMLTHPSTKPSLSKIVIVLNIITFFIV